MPPSKLAHGGAVRLAQLAPCPGTGTVEGQVEEMEAVRGNAAYPGRRDGLLPADEALPVQDLRASREARPRLSCAAQSALRRSLFSGAARPESPTKRSARARASSETALAPETW